MISYIRLKNFKSFSDVTLDLRGQHGIPKKLAFIYGENGAGKSNLMLAFQFLSQSFETLKLQVSHANSDFSTLSNLDEENIPEELIGFLKAFRSRFHMLPDLLERNWSIGSNEPMEIEMGFYINEKNGYYFAKFNNEKIIEERLYYTISERSGVIFNIDSQKATLSPSVFTDGKYKLEMIDAIEKYWGKHTMISILFNEISTKNREYISNRVSEHLLVVLNMLRSISFWHKGINQDTARLALPYKFLRHLDKGNISSKEDKELKTFEKALHEFFTQLYSDIKRVYYRFTKNKNGYNYELYFDKLCGGMLRPIPISLESTGTKKLLDIFPFLYICTEDTSVLVDEVDSGIHDLLMCSLINTLQETLKLTREGQFIATTHNTLLLDSLEAENVYILRSNINGEKKISCISDYQFRTHKNNSLRQKYLHGSYQGIPESGYLDLIELVRETESALKTVDKSREV